MVEVARPGWVRGEKALRQPAGVAISQGPWAHFFWRLQDPGWGVGVRARPNRSPGALTSRVPAIARRRLGDLPRAWHPIVSVTPGPPGLPTYPCPQRPNPPGSLRTHRAVRGAHAPPQPACCGGAPSPAPPLPRPRPTCCLKGSPTPSP